MGPDELVNLSANLIRDTEVPPGLLGLAYYQSAIIINQVICKRKILHKLIGRSGRSRRGHNNMNSSIKTSFDSLIIPEGYRLIAGQQSSIQVQYNRMNIKHIYPPQIFTHHR